MVHGDTRAQQHTALLLGRNTVRMQSPSPGANSSLNVVQIPFMHAPPTPCVRHAISPQTSTMASPSLRSMMRSLQALARWAGGGADAAAAGEFRTSALHPANLATRYGPSRQSVAPPGTTGTQRKRLPLAQRYAGWAINRCCSIPHRLSDTRCRLPRGRRPQVAPLQHPCNHASTARGDAKPPGRASRRSPPPSSSLGYTS